MFAMKKILAPIDFSIRSVGAARYVEALSEHFGSEAVFLHVLPSPHYEFGSMEVGGTLLNDLFANRTEQVRQELAGFLREELPGLRASRVLLEGDPARKIVEYAHEQQVDLVVVSTHGYGPFRRFILGSVTAKILHDIDRPVWTGVHLEEAPEVKQIDFKTVLAAVDLGPHSEKPLAWASAFAQSYNARLVIVHAAPCIEGRKGEYPDPEWRRHIKDEAIEGIRKLQKKVASQAEIIVECGDAPETVCSAAHRLGADLLVIGRGSAAGISGRLRANAYSIIRQSPRPVVSV
jgi:nucleotide-binding universal stress UspA family protein